MRKLAFIHPILWALIPTLALYRANIGELSTGMLPLPLLVSVAFALFFWAFFARILRADAHQSAYLTSYILLMVFSYGHIYRFTGDFNATVPYWRFISFGIWFVLLIAGLIVLARLKIDRQILTDWLFAGALVIFLYLVGHISWYEIGRWRTASQLESHHISYVPHVSKEKMPDIYYLILDSYPGNETLKRIFNQDNHLFLGALKDHGFYVAEESRSNYCQTILSLNSSMSFTYLDEVAKEAGPMTNNREPLEEMIQENRVCDILRQCEYRIISIPSSYEPVNFPSDIELEQKDGISDFNKALMDTTPLLVVSLGAANTPFDPYATHRKQILWQFEHIPDTFTIPGPKFVFIHILAPHQPLVFDAVGNPLKAEPYDAVKSGRHWRQRPNSRDEYNRKLAGEITYLNNRTLEIIDGIKSSAKRPTVIIVQGDHGPGFLPDQEKDLTGMSIPERFNILNAYYFSDGDTHLLYPTISPVNSFRAIFNTYFGEHYPLLDDRSYFSPFLKPYHFLDITDATHYGDGAKMLTDQATLERILAYEQK